MSKILVVDDMPVIREPIAAALRSNGYDAICAGDGREALTLVRQSPPPDLVVLDLSMPGMDGMAVLRALRSDPKTLAMPVILLTGSSDKAQIVEAGKMGVRDYLLKTRFVLSDLLARVQKNLGIDNKQTSSASANKVNETLMGAIGAAAPANASATAQGAAFVPLTRQQMIERVEKCTQIKTLPGAVAELMALVNSARSDVSDLASALKRDPVLATRVLNLANSASFASQKPRIATIDEAVRNIGVAGVRGMVISAGIFESFPPQGAGQLHITRCWQHSFAMASVMDKLVAGFGNIEPGVAHLAGLCYDLCDIVLRQYFAEEYQAIADLVASTGRPAWQVRSTVFGMPYYELVTLVLGKLNLPSVIVTPIAEVFARSTNKEEGRGSGILARMLRIANVYAHGLMLAAGLDAPIVPISTTEYRSTFGDAPVPALDPAMLRSEVLMTVNLLAGLSAHEAAELCRPPISPAARKILYWRHASYCGLDPLATLLSFAGEVTIVSQTPTDVAGFDALIVAAPRHESPAQQQLSALTKLSSNAIPALFLSGLAPQSLAATRITCRQLPISLTDAATFLDLVKSGYAAAA